MILKKHVSIGGAIAFFVLPFLFSAQGPVLCLKNVPEKPASTEGGYRDFVFFPFVIV
jgi:hypothetical protein